MESLLVFTVLVAILTIIFITYVIEHRRVDHIWSGLVQGKKIKEYYYKGQHRKAYLLQILKDTGEKLALDVTEDIYISLQVGDKIRKDKGQYYPTKSV
jgi:hypothetical protein